MKIYNKLVRDKIPEIIALSGNKVTFRALQGDELNTALAHKLVEEVSELLKAQTKEQIAEEIADVKQVLRAIQDAYDIVWDVVDIQRKKLEEKGGFLKGFFLESVEE